MVVKWSSTLQMLAASPTFTDYNSRLAFSELHRALLSGRVAEARQPPQPSSPILALRAAVSVSALPRRSCPGCRASAQATSLAAPDGASQDLQIAGFDAALIRQ